MIRKIIRIDETKCSGCGACAAACHEGAIGMVNGVAKLLRDDYCDGFGDCLPSCPTGAISFEEREATPYSESEVLAARREKRMQEGTHIDSALSNFPVQLKLAPVTAPYYQNADLLIAADCTAYAYGDFHRDFIKRRVTLIGCPKLDAADYSKKLEEILKNNAIRSVTLTRMVVPCCGGLEYAVKLAIAASGKDIPLAVVTIMPDGSIKR